MPHATVLDRAGDQLGDFLPSLGAALAVLIIGLLLVRLLARVLRATLARLGLDKAADRLRVHDAMARIGLERSLSRVIVAVLSLAASTAVILIAISTLGLRTLDDALNETVLFLPKLLSALAIALVGVAISGVVRERVDRAAFQMELRGPLGATAQTFVLAIAGIIALGQVGVSTTILVVVAGIVLAGAALTAALAFGLGTKDVAAELSAGRYASGAFHIGDRIRLDDGVVGEIVALEPASFVLEADDGRRFRIPNSTLVRTMVELDPPRAPSET